MERSYAKLESCFRHDWANARGRDAICWGGQKYASGYGALGEFFEQVKNVLCLCWATEEELNQLRASELDADLLDLYAEGDQQKLYNALNNIEGDNDILDLLVYAEQEYAILYREAEEREREKQRRGEDWTAYRPASEFLDETKFKDLPALKRLLAKHPEIRTRKPSPQRLEIHAGDWLAYLKEQEKGAFAALDKNPEAVEAFLQEVRQRQDNIRRSKAT